MATCLYCGKCLASLSVHGQRIHTGRCSVTDHEGVVESEPSPEPPIGSDWGFQLFHGDETGPPEDIPDAVAPARRAITHPFASDADWNLVQFVGNHDSMPTGMLQELLRIFAMGGLTFRTTYDLFNQVDDLPGVPFEPCTAFLDPIPGIEWVPAHGPRVDYTVFKRSIVDLLKSCLADEAATFLNVSRGYVLKLMDEGQLPFRSVGSHRRIPGMALAAYRARQDVVPRKAMDDLVALSAEMGLYDNPGLPPPKADFRGKGRSE